MSLPQQLRQQTSNCSSVEWDRKTSPTQNSTADSHGGMASFFRAHSPATDLLAHRAPALRPTASPCDVIRGRGCRGGKRIINRNTCCPNGLEARANDEGKQAVSVKERFEPTTASLVPTIADDVRRISYTLVTKPAPRKKLGSGRPHRGIRPIVLRPF